MPQKTFAFRQRAGRFNWKLVSSVDLFAIIDDLRVDELQGALDAVTFSEFTPSDVKRSSIESTTKLVHLMQLMIEYLLYCQEAELQLIHELRDELADWKRANKDLRKENVGLKEDISIYKRQMAALNKSLSRVADRDDNGKIIYRAVNEPTAPKSSDIKPLLEPICQMIESVQKHERDTRDFMMESLHEQRQLFIQQLSEMHAKTSSGQGDLRELLETQWRQQADKDNEKLRELVKANESLHDELARKDSEVLNAQREAQAARDTVAQRDGTIRELERDIAEKSRAIKAAELQKLKEDTIKKDIPTNKSVELFRVKSRHGAILSIFGVFQNALVRKVSKHFRRWSDQVVHEKLADLQSICDASQGEVYAANVREKQLQLQVESLKQRLAIETSRNNMRERIEKLKPLRVDSSVNTSSSLEVREGSGLKDLAWGDLVGGNAYLAGITSESDMMARLDARLEAKLQRDLDPRYIDSVFRELAEEVLDRARKLSPESVK